MMDGPHRVEDPHFVENECRPYPMLELVRPYLGLLILCTLLVALVSGIGLLGPQLAGSLVDAAAIQGDLSQINENITRLLALFALLGLLTYAHVRIIRSVGAKLLCDLRQRVFDRLVSLSPGFFEQRSTGELLSRLNADLAKIQQVLIEQLPQGLQSCLTFVGTLAILFLMHTRLTLFSLLLAPAIALAAIWSGRRLEALSSESLDAVAVANARAQEAIVGIRTVQAFGQEGYERQRYGLAMRQVLHREFRIGHYAGAFLGLMEFIGFGAFALVLGYGSHLIAGGELSPGELTAFLLYTLSLTMAVAELGDLFIAYRELKGASKNVLGSFAVTGNIEDRPEAVELPRLQGHIELRNVDFAYPAPHAKGSPQLLRNISLNIQAGETIALVGPNGAGKTTLLSLLLRYYDPAAGAIYIDGHDLRTLKLSSLRNAIAVVSQHVFLFSASIAENIRYGDPSATLVQVEEAARAAGVEAFVRDLERGYESQIGELGYKLSGGQRQQIAIARAFLRNAPILLLDEATNSLDPPTEELIHEALNRLMRGRTTIAIAHRWSSAQRADRVVFIDRGQIRGVGEHARLYAGNEQYHRHWERQGAKNRVCIHRLYEMDEKLHAVTA